VSVKYICLGCDGLFSCETCFLKNTCNAYALLSHPSARPGERAACRCPNCRRVGA